MEVFFPGGTPIEDFDRDTEGDRIGRRMRAIRTEQGLTQGELGEKVGLNANRVQQYENGHRKPKFELCKKFADALEVETSALLDPQVTTYVGAMYAFFEMENIFGLRLKEVDGQICLCFGEGMLDPETRTMNKYLREWYERRKEKDEDFISAESKEDRKRIIHDYHMWEWNYPFSKDKNALSKSERTAELEASQRFEKALKERGYKLVREGGESTTGEEEPIDEEVLAEILKNIPDTQE